MYRIKRYANEKTVNLYYVDINEKYITGLNNYILNRIDEKNFTPLNEKDIIDIFTGEETNSRIDEEITLIDILNKGNFRIKLFDFVKDIIDEDLYNSDFECIDSDIYFIEDEIDEI